MKRILSVIVIGASSLASAATLTPIQLLNPAGSTSGQSIVSTGPSTAPAWGTPGLATIGANSVLANATASTAAPVGLTVPSCSAAGNNLQYTTNTGFTCATGYAQLASPTFTGTVTTAALTATGAITPSQTAGIVGTTTNNSANAGSVGEYGNVLGSAVALTTATNANITSQSLGAGDWDVWASISYNNPGTTNIASVTAGVSTTSAAFAGDPTMLRMANQGAGFSVGGAIPQQRLLLSGATTVYCVAQASFTVSTLTATCQLHWRRRR